MTEFSSRTRFVTVGKSLERKLPGHRLAGSTLLGCLPEGSMDFDGGQEDSLLQEILIAGGAGSLQQQEAAREAERHQEEELRFGAQHSSGLDRFSFEQWSRPGD